MAQYTPYADVSLNTRAIANYNNPMFNVLRSGLGWLENQGQQIADRKKAELLKQIQDEDMIDRYTQARNNKQDLAKALYGDTYFINSNDADLDKAMEALKTKESNRMLETVGRDIVSKVNQDVYKAGNEQELLSALGFNNRTTKELNDIRDFAQQQLKNRYEPYIQGKLADREVLEGKVSENDIDNIVSSFKEKYGMDVNPAFYYDSEKRKNQRQTALNSKLGQIASQVYAKKSSPEEALDQYRLLALTNPNSANEIGVHIQATETYLNKQYKAEILNMLSDARKDFTDDYGTIDYRGVARAVRNKAVSIGIPPDIVEATIDSYFSKQSNNAVTQRIDRELSQVELENKDLKEKYGYIFESPMTTLSEAMLKDFGKNAKEAFNDLASSQQYSSLGLTDADYDNLLKFVHKKIPGIISLSTKEDIKKHLERYLKEYHKIVTDINKGSAREKELRIQKQAVDSFGRDY